MTSTRTSEVKIETVQSQKPKEREFNEIHTYDAETGYHILSVFPVSSDEERKAETVRITEEMIRLMKGSALSKIRKHTDKKVHSGSCNSRKCMLS